MSSGFLSRHDRRWFLKLAGGSVALAHWLQSGIARAETGTSAKRLVVLHRPNGGDPQKWIVNGQPGPILKPFENVWNYAVALKGMTVRPGNNSSGADPHGAALQTIMTGAHLLNEVPNGSDDGRWNSVESLDQTWSKKSPVFNVTPIRSLQVGANGRMDGLQEPQNRTLSYGAARTPLFPVISPYDIQKQLVSKVMPGGGGVGQNKLFDRRTSVLSFVKGDLARVRKQFPGEMKPSLDAHEAALADLEKSLSNGKPPTAMCSIPDVPANLPIDNVGANEVEKVGAAHFSLLKAAFACDLTRMVTFMWGPGASAGAFTMHGVGNHHSTSHQDERAKLGAVDRWFSEKTAPFIQSLIDAPDPTGGKLIDNTLVWYINENSYGANHSLDDMPFVLFGGDGVGLTSRGRVADVSGRTSNDVWLSIAKRFGVDDLTSLPTEHKGPIPGLIS
jgi:Protein of unknown function (DUF1552)